ncbi:hypothetical protein C8Q77DRAFT_1092903 [Trametes polyzona]|nr:hypothetical protein C8Q77DRAFT_1092903 [Trametes polyzona]
MVQPLLRLLRLEMCETTPPAWPRCGLSPSYLSSESPVLLSYIPTMSSGKHAYPPAIEGQNYRYTRECYGPRGRFVVLYVGRLETTLESSGGERALLRFGNGKKVWVSFARCSKTNEHPTFASPPRDERMQNPLRRAEPGLPPEGSFPFPDQLATSTTPSFRPPRRPNPLLEPRRHRDYGTSQYMADHYDRSTPSPSNSRHASLGVSFVPASRGSDGHYTNTGRMSMPALGAPQPPSTHASGRGIVPYPRSPAPTEAPQNQGGAHGGQTRSPYDRPQYEIPYYETAYFQTFDDSGDAGPSHDRSAEEGGNPDGSSAYLPYAAYRRRTGPSDGNPPY